jgi:DNA-binding transcriptional LysR family regulator
MNIKQLETFYWIERLGSFTAAAERLNATQSTISMRMQELEESFGVKLFDRSHRTARLTPKGKELVAYVRQLIDLTAEMQQRIAPPEALSGLVRLGVVELVAATWLPRYLKALHERYPNIVLELDVALSFDLINKLHGGGLDVVFALGHPLGSGYITESLGAVQFEWMASPTLGIPSGTVEPRELQAWPFITLSRQSYHHSNIEAWLKANKVRCRRIDTCNSMSVVASLTVAGLGISLIPPSCYRREIDEGKLRVIRTGRKMSPVEFFAMYPIDEFQPLTRVVADLAVEISDFDRIAPALKKARRA